MQESSRTFCYTAQRGSYLSLIGVFAFLLIVEGGATELFVALLVPIPWLKLAILAVTIVSSLYIFMLLLSPLWTKHRLTDTHLHLQYGFSLHVRIPLSAISDARGVRKSASRIQPLSAYYEAKKQSIVACFSDQGMVLLILNQPIALKFGLRARATTNILLNVDRRDEFMDALGLAQGVG